MVARLPDRFTVRNQVSPDMLVEPLRDGLWACRVALDKLDAMAFVYRLQALFRLYVEALVCMSAPQAYVDVVLRGA
jgi:hypothetical protein